MSKAKQNEAFENLYDRSKKFLDRLNQATANQEPLRDSVIIADIPKDTNNTILKSYDTIDKADLLEYSINKPNGSLNNSKLKDSLSNTYVEESSNNNSRFDGILNSEGKFIKVDISQYKSLVLKYGKIIFKNTYMNNSFVNNNDILYLESKIPIFKANSSGEVIYDTLKNYHQQGSDKEDRDNIVNINQSNSHKINLDENNFAAITGSKIFIFLHKIIQGNFRKKNNGAKKNISSAESTQVIQNSDIIIGYSTLEMNKIFLSEDFKFSGKINVIEKKKVIQKKNSKKNVANNGLNEKNKKGASKDKDKVDALYDEKGERIIGTLDITCYLKRPIKKIFKDEKEKNEKFINQINKNYINDDNNFNVNNVNNNINNRRKPSPEREFIIGQPAAYNQHNNSITNNTNIDNLNIQENEFNEKNENIRNKEGLQEIQTDINGDILILYLKINDIKASNYTVPTQEEFKNINNVNDFNKNIIVYNYNGPQPAKRNFFLRHKIFPDNRDVNSEIVWNKIAPDFNYSIQMPFTLTQKTAELLDNGKFIVEIWIKGENNNDNECLGIVSFDLRNVLESLKVDDNTITTLQLYKNTFPYIIYDDYYQVIPITEKPDLGTLYLKTCIGIGTPSQVNSFTNLIKKTQQNVYNQYNGLYNNRINENNINNNNQNNQKHISLDPFKEDNKNVIKDDVDNISRAADINVDGIMEQNHKEINNINLSKSSSIIQKDTFKKTESFYDPNKKKITNPFLVPQNYENNQNDQNSKKETAGFANNILLDENNKNRESQRYNPDYNPINNTEKNLNINKKIETKNITTTQKKSVEYNINITHKHYENTDNTNKDQTIKNDNSEIVINNKKENNDNQNYEDDFVNGDNNNINKNNEEQNPPQFNYNEKNNDNKYFDNDDENSNYYNSQNNIKKIENKENEENSFEEKMNNNIIPQNIKVNEEKNKINMNIEQNNNNIIKENPLVKKHIFTVSIDKIYNCQIISKLPPTYLRYQFFTDQKPLRSELFNYSQYSIDSSVIDVDMKSIHSIILPKIEKIKDYLNDFLVEFLYDDPIQNKCCLSNNHIIIGRVNIPSDEFASLVSENNGNNNIKETNRVLFIYGTEKIQRNKCIIGKLKLNFKYVCVDVPMNYNNGVFNGSLSLSNNVLLNSVIGDGKQTFQQQSSFGGSIYLEKETIFNRKIPKNARLKINVQNFASSSLFEDYYRKQFSIYFIFSAFGEVSKMENQYGKRTTSKKYNLLNCDFNEILTYKLEIDQDIIDYLKCRNGYVYLMYKVIDKNYMENNDDENINKTDVNLNEDNKQNNLFELTDYGTNNKRIIGKGMFNLNDILTSADINYQQIPISQIGNGSMSLGNLNISLVLENDSNNLNIVNEEGEIINKENYEYSPISKFKQNIINKNNGLNDLYNLHNKTFNKCDPSLYLNGKFLFSIDFRKFYYELTSDIGRIINNNNSYFFFVFKLGNKIKKISPKFNKETNELFSLNLGCNLLLINYIEMIELDLNFNKKMPSDIYNLFNEGILEIKLYQNDNSISLGSFYVDLHKLITSELFSENLLYSGNNVINLIDVRNNSYKNCKIELNLTIFKLNEFHLSNEIEEKRNYLTMNVNNNEVVNNLNNVNNSENNIIDASASNLDYCEYYQYLFVKDFSDYLIRNIFFNDDYLNNNIDKNNKDQLNNSFENNIINFNIDKFKKIFTFNSIDMFSFINNNLISLVDSKGDISIYNFKKIFKLITKLNYDIFDYYYSSSLINNNNNNGGDGNAFNENTFDYYLTSKIINLDNEDINVLNYLKEKQTNIDVCINNNANDKNNKTIKKLLTAQYNYGFNETNDYCDVVGLCLFLFDYYYNLNDNTLMNCLKIKNNSIIKDDQININKNNVINPNFDKYKTNPLKIPMFNILQNNTKVMVVTVLNGHNIVVPNSDFNSRPNSYFVLEFDDKNYTSDIVMNSSQPNFNEELEIKINAEDYIQKLNSLLIFISLFSFVDENNSIFIGRCEISPSKMFPFLNDNNECEDFFHVIGEGGQIMGQLNIKFKFESDVINSITTKAVLNRNSTFNINNINGIDNNRDIISKTIPYNANNNYIQNNKKKFTYTTDLNDPLHKKLAEAMNSIDNLTQILQNKVNNEKNMNDNNDNMYKKNEENENLSDIKSEENLNNNEINNPNNSNEYNPIDNVNNFLNNGIAGNEMFYDKNQQFNLNNNIQNISNDGDDFNKLTMTDYNPNNNFCNSEKLSHDAEDDKASCYSENKGNNINNQKKVFQGYDKKLLNRIQKIMKNQK